MIHCFQDFLWTYNVTIKSCFIKTNKRKNPKHTTSEGLLPVLLSRSQNSIKLFTGLPKKESVRHTRELQ